MTAMPRTTSREEQAAVLAGAGPVGGERLIEYNLFLTDAFGGPAGQITYQPAPGVPDEIDGFQNDDSYRRSRHLLNRPGASPNNDNLRENSLARQLQEKDDQPATIRLIRRRLQNEMTAVPAGASRLPWVNIIPPNTKFFLESVQENREEKVQIIDTFGEWVAFFFGRKPEIYNYSGTLLNAKNHDWKNEFQENYESFLRGSQAVKYRATMMLQYDDVMVEGYMFNCQISMAAAVDKSVPFAFSLLVINRAPLNRLNMIGLRLARSNGSDDEFNLLTTLTAALGQAKAGDTESLETFLLMREYFAGNYVPPAGMVTHLENTNNVQSGLSKTPGASSGVTNEKPVSSPFTPTTTAKINDVGLKIIPNI